jgi:MFS family permease
MPANPALGIDFGTSNTTAVLRRSDARVETVMFDGSPLLPSAVFAEADGTILVGRDAIDSARQDPARFEPHPKRRVDDGVILLGDREIPVVELFTAVLARVRRECEQILGALPPQVVLTHPATWGPTRRRVLQDAARAAGLPNPVLVPEPVAAAAYYVAELGNRIPVGSAVVVHDFGGGTFDASVVRRTQGGFEVLAVDGLDDLGGRDIDEAIVNRLRESVGASSEWDRLLRPTTAADRRQWRAFHDDVKAAKERLSRNSTADLYVPVLDREVHFTREELETLTAPLLARAPGIVKGVIQASGLPESAIAGVFLVGGASRMPLAATMLHRELGRPPTVIDRLEQVVAHGALLTGTIEPAGPQPYRPVPPMSPYRPAQPAPNSPQPSPSAYQPVPPASPQPSPGSYQPVPPDSHVAATAPPTPPHDGPMPARRGIAHSVLGVFAAASAAVPPLAVDMYLPGLPAIAEELGVSALAAQITLSAFMIGALVGLLVTGPLSDRLGRRGPLLAATGLFTLGALAAALAPGISMLIVARFVQGLAGAGCMVLIRAVLGDRAEGLRLSRSFTVLSAILVAAAVAAPILGGGVIAAFGWRAAFQVLTVVGAVSWAMVFFSVPETLPKERRGDTRPSQAWRRPRGVALAAACCAAAMFVYLGGSGFLFANGFGTAPAVYGVILAINAAGAVTGGALIGALARRGNPKRSMYAAVAITGIGAILLATAGADDMTVAWAALVIALFGLGGVTPAILVLAREPEHDMHSAAAWSCLLGALAAPVVGLVDAWQAPTMATTILAAAVVAAITAVRTARKPAEPISEAEKLRQRWREAGGAS